MLIPVGPLHSQMNANQINSQNRTQTARLTEPCDYTHVNPVCEPCTMRMGLRDMRQSLRYELLQVSQRGYSPFSRMNISPRKLVCSKATKLERGGRRARGGHRGLERVEKN